MLIVEYQDNLYKAALAVLRDPADSQDAVQLTFIKYCQSDLDFRDREHIRKWLFRTVLNQSKDIRRAFWRRSRTALDESVAAPEFRSQISQELYEAVSSLPSKYRVTLQLYYYEDFSIREIAQLTGQSETAVKTRLSRGRGSVWEPRRSRSWRNPHHRDPVAGWQGAGGGDGESGRQHLGHPGKGNTGEQVYRQKQRRRGLH
ncbi:RNA polymerase sigma factor [Faecalibaculum rodentium]|uniref:RNA polymerase sigma factor n=1 Tax=Faecalibaculum rodentium TaxID=1702221 RepID=UPI003F67DDF0